MIHNCVNILHILNNLYQQIILLQHKTNKEDEKAFYGGSRFEMICNHEDDPKTSNGFFCKVLCGLCEKGNECCIANHLGCDVSGWAVNDQSSFLRGEGKEALECADPADVLSCGVHPEESLDRLLTNLGLNK